MDRLEELQEQHDLLKEELTKIKLLIKREQIKIAKDNNRLYQVKKSDKSEDKLIGLFICKKTAQIYIDYIHELQKMKENDIYEIIETTIPSNWNEKDDIPAIL